MFKIFKRKKKNENTMIDTGANAYLEPIEVFMNESKNKCGELYFKNGCFTFTISEKLFDDYEGCVRYYWTPVNSSSSFFDTREKAVAEIMSIIEPDK